VTENDCKVIVTALNVTDHSPLRSKHVQEVLNLKQCSRGNQGGWSEEKVKKKVKLEHVKKTVKLEQVENKK
jgi:hypothetical protein